jgi:nicotinate-nucleotide pyrophosphorylase (carboxylating)
MLDAGRYLPFLAQALEEDLGRGDRTTQALVPEGVRRRADLLVKEPGVLAGVPLVEVLLRILDADGSVEVAHGDGETVASGTVAAVVTGRARAILGVERTALNVVRHLSGVATLTARFVEAVRGLPVEIYDTRKTTPGWRELEKYAVVCGGGKNHRLRLDDAAMLKENHLVAAFGRTGPVALAEAVRRTKAALPRGTPLCVEVETRDELESVVDEGADVLMLDGWEIDDLARAVAWVRGRFEGRERPRIEATGGVTLGNVRRIAQTGVDRISVGALTHSAPALDVSLQVRKDPEATGADPA